MRMTRIPAGAELVLNKIPRRRVSGSATSSSWPACRTIMQAMLEYVAPKLKTGVKMLSEIGARRCREGDIGTELGADRQGSIPMW